MDMSLVVTLATMQPPVFVRFSIRGVRVHGALSRKGDARGRYITWEVWVTGSWVAWLWGIPTDLIWGLGCF